MSYVLFEDTGKFSAGRILSTSDNALQVELASGKRVKVKAAAALLRFAAPEPDALMRQAETLSQDIDLDLAWEFAPDEEFGFADLARDYFNAGAGVEHQAAALLRLQGAPHYFRRLGKGQYRKASAETVKAALAGIEKKRQIALQVDAWAQSLVDGQCPPTVREQIYRILFKPDKNAPEYRAVVEASRRAQRSPLDLLRAAGAIGNAYQFHWRRFLFERFPQGVAHAQHAAPSITDELPLSGVQAFSIDDSATTEIDDALSVQGLGSGRVVVGIHIAAPGLAIKPGSALDQAAGERLSTVYVPGWKVTMLPDAVVQAYTLAAGQAVPAVSLYVTFDEATLELLSSQTTIERVPIAANLRHDQLDAEVTEDALLHPANAGFAFAHELGFLHRLALSLKAQREVVRGKPENFNRPDPVYRLLGDDGTTAAVGDDGPRGDERIEIGFRRRGAPLDLIVAEAMILANSQWGAWLASLGVPAIYRSQASLAPGIKVRMGTKALPHAGIGVAAYAWSTSPLRRYVDLVNQWQIIAAARHGRTAALAAPFKPRDASLMAIVSAFDAAYADYATVQRLLERYWMLRWVQQQGLQEMDATVTMAPTVRTEAIPLILRAAGADALPRGTRVRLRLGEVDELALDVAASIAARLDATTSTTLDGGLSPGDVESEGDESDAAAGPLQLAISLDDEATAGADASAHADQGANPDNARQEPPNT